MFHSCLGLVAHRRRLSSSQNIHPPGQDLPWLKGLHQSHHHKGPEDQHHYSCLHLHLWLPLGQDTRQHKGSTTAITINPASKEVSWRSRIALVPPTYTVAHAPSPPPTQQPDPLSWKTDKDLDTVLTFIMNTMDLCCCEPVKVINSAIAQSSFSFHSPFSGQPPLRENPMTFTQTDFFSDMINTSHAGCSRNTDPPVDAPDPDCDLVFAPAIAPETVEGFLRDLQQSLGDTTGDEVVAQTPSASLLASTNWSTRTSFFSESWRAARPHLVNTVVAQANVGTHICQQCWSKTSVVWCRDCRPHPFFCADCDVSMHTRHPLHNRDATTAGYFQPLAPTTHVLNMALCSCVRFVPVEIPDKICGCASESLSLKPGKTVTVITMNGRHELSMPELACEACAATWT
ncbi:uncharacterized protein LOC117498605 [Trematomus bernacchii]|uniref:uncharacterized protein LOC117498605 n=1 Tax=Trematomus bernacchii TaxID=40690 RepID=UPI00146AD701|nr:uncharacterized protein LOC117498605 [Trematomus bernacchii]